MIQFLSKNNECAHIQFQNVSVGLIGLKKKNLFDWTNYHFIIVQLNGGGRRNW